MTRLSKVKRLDCCYCSCPSCTTLQTTVFVLFIYSHCRSIASSILVKEYYRHRYHHSCYFRSILVFISFILKLTVVTSSRHNESLYKRNKERKRKFCQILAHMCVSYNERSNWDCLLSVAIDKHSLLYTIILCRIRAKLSTAMIEQNERERERERERKQVLLSSSILSITDLLEGIFRLVLSFMPS